MLTVPDSLNAHRHCSDALSSRKSYFQNPPDKSKSQRGWSKPGSWDGARSRAPLRYPRCPRAPEVSDSNGCLNTARTGGRLAMWFSITEFHLMHKHLIFLTSMHFIHTRFLSYWNQCNQVFSRVLLGGRTLQLSSHLLIYLERWPQIKAYNVSIISNLNKLNLICIYIYIYYKKRKE